MNQGSLVGEPHSSAKPVLRLSSLLDRTLTAKLSPSVTSPQRNRIQSVSHALFTIDGTGFRATDLTRGGWSDDHQHGSPPSGLLARAIEQVETAAPMQVVRFTIDLWRPVPVDRVRVETRVRRDGRRIQVVDSFLVAAGVEVGRASALKIRTTDLTLPERDEEPWQQPAGPEAAHPVEWTDRWGDRPIVRFHLDAVEIRTFDNSFLNRGPATSWFRLLHPLVEGEVDTPFVRLATVADMSNGNSQALDPREWLYVNPDITLYAHRMPKGEWIGMKSAAHQHTSGIGLADTRVFDEDGPLGRINQAQLLDRRARHE